MGCRETEDRLAPYMLGALDSREIAEMEEHVDGCAECRLTLSRESDLTVEMAYAAPQLEVPGSVKRQLLSRVPATPVAPRPAGPLLRWLRLLSGTGQRVATGPAGAVAASIVVVLILAGVWLNVRINDIADDEEALASQLETMADDEAEMERMVNDLRDLTYWANAPDASVKLLSATDTSTDAGGMIVVRTSESAIMLWAANLPQLPSDKVFQVWLVREGTVYSGGVFRADSTGHAIRYIQLPEPVDNFEAILITVEQGDGSPDPSGDPVLRGNLGDL